jgi:hypothetical protein
MTTNRSFLLFLIGFGLVPFAKTMAQTTDSLEIDAPKVISFALDGNIPKALELVNSQPEEKLIRRHAKARNGFNARFAHETDRSDYLTKRHSEIDSLLLIYMDYWRKSFLEHPKVHNELLRKNLSAYLGRNFPAAKKLRATDKDEKFDKYLTAFIQSKGYHSTGFGQTGRFYDLLVWKKQTDTVYNFTLNGQKIQTPVVFMEDFITLGWEEYATLDRAYPGGWAKPHALYCVKQSYDTGSESFLISYLAHEGRHFEDYKLFPKLETADLEYRAKLTELSLLDKKLIDVLTFFINNADAKTEDGHKRADYYVTRDLSKRLFNKEFESNIEAWKALPIVKIHKASAALLIENTQALSKVGRKVKTILPKTE